MLESVVDPTVPHIDHLSLVVPQTGERMDLTQAPDIVQDFFETRGYKRGAHAPQSVPIITLLVLRRELKRHHHLSDAIENAYDRLADFIDAIDSTDDVRLSF